MRRGVVDAANGDDDTLDKIPTPGPSNLCLGAQALQTGAFSHPGVTCTDCIVYSRPIRVLPFLNANSQPVKSSSNSLRCLRDVCGSRTSSPSLWLESDLRWDLGAVGSSAAYPSRRCVDSVAMSRCTSSPFHSQSTHFFCFSTRESPSEAKAKNRVWRNPKLACRKISLIERAPVTLTRLQAT